MVDQVAHPPAAAANAPSNGLPPSIVKIKDAQGVEHTFDLGNFDEAHGPTLFALLPDPYQKRALEMKPFFANFKNKIKDIPAELLKPGGMAACMEMLRKQGGYLSAEQADKDVRAFLEGPYCVELRRTGLYKGVKSANELAGLAATTVEFGTQTLSAYFNALALPVRALFAGKDYVMEGIDTTPKMTDAQALALATAYQGAMYMAMDSDTAPAATKSRDPNVIDHVQTGIQFGWQYIAVVGSTVWNMVTHYDSKKDFAANWRDSWAEARTSYTDGKGFSSYQGKLKENAIERTEGQVRPQTQSMLHGIGTVAGVNAKPYIDALTEDTYYVGYDKQIYRTEKGKPVALPVPGPDGKPLTQQARDQHTRAQVTGGLFEDVGFNLATAAGVVGVTAAGANYKGLAQGAAGVYVNEATHKTDKALQKAQAKLAVVEARVDAAIAGNGSPAPSKGPQSIPALEKEFLTADAKVEELKAQKKLLPDDPAKAMQASDSRLQRLAGRLAEAGETGVPENAKWPTRVGHRLVEMGQWVGNGLGNAAIAVKDGAIGLKNGAVSTLSYLGSGLKFIGIDMPVAAWKKGGSFIAGVQTGTAESLLPKNAGGTTNGLVKGLTDTVDKLEARAGAGGSLLGHAGATVLKGAVVVSPVLELAHANSTKDGVGMAIYGAETVGAVTALKVVGSRAVPGLNVGFSAVNLADGYRTDNGAKKVKAATELGTVALGTGIGAALGFFGGPLAPATVPAGMAIGATIGGWLSMGTGWMAANAYEKSHEAAPAATASAQQKPTGSGALRPDEDLAKAGVNATENARLAHAAAEAKAQAEVQARVKQGLGFGFMQSQTAVVAVVSPASATPAGGRASTAPQPAYGG